MLVTLEGGLNSLGLSGGGLNSLSKEKEDVYIGLSAAPDGGPISGFVTAGKLLGGYSTAFGGEYTFNRHDILRPSLRAGLRESNEFLDATVAIVGGGLAFGEKFGGRITVDAFTVEPTIVAVVRFGAYVRW